MAAKTLMVQGTGSGVGKSIITAALCRRFYKDGWRVAPFKAQNMSLNSFVTEDGGELGRAQAYQAEACGVKPHVAMNPILLKPCGDNGSQVIVMGKVTETQNAKSYYAGINGYRQEIRQALNHLRGHYDLVILEGAGSPAEINLKQWDLVNMPMAEMAGAPVLIVGDIDRGGVFAWMKGTYDLLTPDERNRVGGFIINKFRGDLSLLQPGLRQFERMVHKPVLGVIPYCRDLVVDEEDALPAWNHPPNPTGARTLDVAVLWYPRISNFTDITPLASDPSVGLRYVSHPAQLGQPDLIILPGSKNTIEDLRFLKSQGLDRAVRERYRQGTILLGLCGGFQMLGGKIRDPLHLETRHGEAEGLQFFDLDTTLRQEKITRQVWATTLTSPVFPAGSIAEGYEIHMGVTEPGSPYPPLFAHEDENTSRHLGITNPEGTLVGTYLHGFLDRDELQEDFLKHVRGRRGLPEPDKKFQYQRFRQQQLDRLTHLVCESLDMQRIRDILQGKEVREPAKP